MTPAVLPLGPSSPERPAEEASWRALDVWAVFNLVGGAFAAPMVLSTLGALLALFSPRWPRWMRVTTVVVVLAPFGLLPISGFAAVVTHSVAASVSGVLLALVLRRTAD